MNAKEKAALEDFVATVVWPARTVRAVTTPAGERDFALVGTWNTTYDTAMAWIDGNRVTDAITWNSATSVRLPATVPYGRLVIILISPGAGAGYMPRNPGVASFLGDVSMGNNRLTDLAPSEQPSDAVRRDEVIAIAQALIGANYALLSGAVFTGPVTVPAASEAGHAVRKSQVALLNGTQAFTAEQKGVAASTSTGFTTKGQMEAALAAAAVGLTRPNRKQVWSTPGQFADAWTAPADGILYMELDGPGGGAAGGYTGSETVPEGAKPGDGGKGGRVRVAVSVTAGQTADIDVGGGGYGSAAHDDSGIGGSGGGGGGRSTRVTIGSNIINAGAGAGGGGISAEATAAGVGGPGGEAGANSAGAGGAAGTAGGDTTDGGVGGTAGGWTGGDGADGGGSATPSTLLPTSPVSIQWPFGGMESGAETGAGADGGLGTLASAGTNGSNGSVTFWWYQP